MRCLEAGLAVFGPGSECQTYFPQRLGSLHITMPAVSIHLTSPSSPTVSLFSLSQSSSCVVVTSAFHGSSNTNGTEYYFLYLWVACIFLRKHHSSINLILFVFYLLILLNLFLQQRFEHLVPVWFAFSLS